MESWSAPERNTQTAACWAALGFPIRVEKQLDANSGFQACVFFIGEHTAPGFPKRNLSRERQAYQSGDMERDTPLHPLLMAMRAMHNFNVLMDWIKQGDQRRLKPVANGQAMIYTPGTAHTADPVIVQTGDIDACAALATLGVPVCAIDGHGNQHRFSLPHLGLDMMGGQGIYNTDAAQLLKELREGNLHDFDDDFMAGYNALKARRELMGAIYAARASVLIQKPGTSRRAYVMQNAKGATMDAVRKHFKIA